MKVGLTGGIGCGKSTVTGYFAEAGFRTVETDVLVRELLAEDAGVRTALRERWGEAVFEADGAVDRPAVAERVFADVAELDWLEALLHPKVRTRWRERLEAAPEAEWLVEIPLLFEKRLETAFDFTVCVCSPDDVAEARLRRRGLTGDTIERRRRRQMPLDEKMDRADFVLSNSGSLDFLKLQTTRLIEVLRGR